MEITASKEFGKKILSKRKEKKLSRAKLGEIIGLHETTIKKYEDGNIKNISLEKIKQFSEALDIPFWEIVTVKSSEKEESDQIECMIQVHNALNNLLTMLDSYHFNKNEIELFIKRLLLNDPGSPLYEYCHTEFINVYDNLNDLDFKSNLNNVQTTIVNPYPNIKLPLFALKNREEGMNKTIPKNVYSIISPMQNFKNEDIILVCLDDNKLILRKFYRLNETTIILQPESTNSTYTTMVFEGEDIKKIKLIGKYVGHITLDNLNEQ